MGVPFSQKRGFPLFSQTFPLCAALPSPTSLDLLHSSLGCSRSFFFPIYHQDFQILSPGITFIHLCIYTFIHSCIYTFIPCPFSFIKYLPVPGWGMYGSTSSHTGWLIPHSTQRTRLWGSIAGCPMSHCASGGSQGADTSS